VGISVGGNVFSGIELEETDLFDVLGIASSRIIPGLGFGCGGSTLIGNGFALIPQRPIEQENGLYEKLRQIETEEYLAAFGLEVFTLPQPLIDLFYDDMRREMGTTRRVVVPSLDLDYKMLLLRQANHLFISSDYYDRFKGQITQTLEKLKKQFGVGVTVAQEDFQYAMNVPELPDGSVVVNAECKNLIAAFDRAKIPYHVISWDFTGSDISCGSYGGLRCAGQFFEV
jgi:hypothetical protein